MYFSALRSVRLYSKWTTHDKRKKKYHEDCLLNKNKFQEMQSISRCWNWLFRRVYLLYTVRKSILYQIVLTVFSSSARCVCSQPAVSSTYIKPLLHSLSGPLRYRKFRFIKWYLLRGVGWQMLSVSALNRFRSIQLVLRTQNRNVCFRQICSVMINYYNTRTLIKNNITITILCWRAIDTDEIALENV